MEALVDDRPLHVPLGVSKPGGYVITAYDARGEHLYLRHPHKNHRRHLIARTAEEASHILRTRRSAWRLTGIFLLHACVTPRVVYACATRCVATLFIPSRIAAFHLYIVKPDGGWSYLCSRPCVPRWHKKVGRRRE